MDDQKMWQWLREKRSQKEQEGTGALPPARSTPPTPEATPPSSSAESAWPKAQQAATTPEMSDEARQTLRAALEAFREQQGAPAPRRGPSGRPGRAPAPAPEPEPVEDSEPLEDQRPRMPKSKQEINEALEYLEECLDDYERFVTNIGNNGFTAPMTLYYRDEVQDLLDELTNAGVEMQEYWRRTVELDKTLHLFRQELVDEIGWANFKQYQIINDPPPQNWWWFLNRETRAPQPPPAFWQFWKK